MAIPFVDQYAAEARILPGLALVVPPVLTVWGLYPTARTLGSFPVVATAGVAVLVVLSHVVRSWGKAAEVELFRRWGGAPTTRRLRHRHAADPIRVAELHRVVAAATKRRLPDGDEEAQHPKAADSAYVAAVELLRELTRDASRFPVVLAENAGYGMRRNLWGARWRGTAVVALGMLAAAVLLGGGLVSLPLALAVILMNGVGLYFWQGFVNQRWVQDASELYADALFRAASALAADSA